jgi:hypothetical protein
MSADSIYSTGRGERRECRRLVLTSHPSGVPTFLPDPRHDMIVVPSGVLLKLRDVSLHL